MKAEALITVWLEASAGHEDELNDWYDTEHVPQVASLPGIVNARRYRARGQLKYLAWYDAADENVEGGSGFQRITSRPTPWAQRMRRLHGGDGERMNFRLMCDVGRVLDQDTPWLYIVHTDIPDHIVDEYNAWYDREHLPRLVTVPGVVRARRYAAVTANGPKYLTAYELTDPDAFESPAGLQARKTPWTAKMRSLFQNTRRDMCQLIRPSVRHSRSSASAR